MTATRGASVVGVAQATWRPDGSSEPLTDGLAPEPLDMWELVARRAAADAGAPGLVERLDDVRVVYCQSWPYDDPARRLTERLGSSPRHARYTGIGGTTPLLEVTEACRAVERGDADVSLVVSGEALATKRRLKRVGERPRWSHRHPTPPSMPFEAPFHDAEVAHEVFQAWLTFALWDVARRAHLGVEPSDYRAMLGEVMAALSARSAGNPHAWFPGAIDAATLATPTPDNRMVGSPYTKRMVSVMDVDMAAAVLVASAEVADVHGVAPDRRVHLHGQAYGRDPVYVAEHDPTHRSPAMEAVFAQALAEAGVGVDDVALFDIYSCFASSVNFAADALGISPTDPRGLTVTGGLPYAGGPGSGYLTHSIAAMVDELRQDPDAVGLVSGVGMHMTKHVAGVLGVRPGRVGDPDDRLQQQLDVAHPPRTVVHEHLGAVGVVTGSVVHGRDGSPEWALIVGELENGSRCYAKVLAADLLDELGRAEIVGRTAHLTPTDGPMGRMNVVTELR